MNSMPMVGSVPRWRRGSKKPKRLSVKQQAVLFETVADLLENGFSMQAALRFVVDIHGHDFQVLTPVLQQLAAGESLASALQAYIAVDLYYQLLIAEQHGALTATLIQAGHLMRTRTTQRQQIRRLLQYPILLLVVLFSTVGVVRTMIMPNFAAINPTPVTGLTSWQWLLIGVGGVIGSCLLVGAAYLSRLPIRRRYARLARLPLIGPLVKAYCGYYLTMNAGMLLAGGLGLRGICEVSTHFKSQSLLQQQGAWIEHGLLAGQSLPDLIAADRLLPDELILLIGKANPAEQLSQELLYFANVQYQKLVRQLNRLISWIQPTMFLIIAGVILVTYMNILLPMYHSMGEILK